MIMTREEKSKTVWSTLLERLPTNWVVGLGMLYLGVNSETMLPEGVNALRVKRNELVERVKTRLDGFDSSLSEIRKNQETVGEETQNQLDTLEVLQKSVLDTLKSLEEEIRKIERPSPIPRPINPNPIIPPNPF